MDRVLESFECIDLINAYALSKIKQQKSYKSDCTVLDNKFFILIEFPLEEEIPEILQIYPKEFYEKFLEVKKF